jgi:hypothetical protein
VSLPDPTRRNIHDAQIPGHDDVGEHLGGFVREEALIVIALREMGVDEAPGTPSDAVHAASRAVM